MSTLIDGPARSAPGAGGLARLAPVAGSAWFLLLALVYGRRLPELVAALHAAPTSFAAWAPVLSQACTVGFLATLAWLMMARPPAVARRAGLGVRIIALGGTYGAWAIAVLPQAALPPPLALVSAAAILCGSLLIIVSVLHLGRSFSIAPQARRLVTRGPYALVRHPLYAAEEIALAGVAMHVVWTAAVPFLLAHVAMQLLRMGYEEEVLSRVFPEYEAYAQRTARWIPGLW